MTPNKKLWAATAGLVRQYTRHVRDAEPLGLTRLTISKSWHYFATIAINGAQDPPLVNAKEGVCHLREGLQKVCSS